MFLYLARIYILGALFVCSNAFATTYSLPCGECGNSTEARVINTAIFLATVADSWGNNVIKPNDRVRIIADDGTKAVYKKYSQYAGIG